MIFIANVIRIMHTADQHGLVAAKSAQEPHLGGNIDVGDPHTFSPKAWTYLLERFAIGSVLDLGSGYGNAADFFFKKGLRTVAVDGLPENINIACFPTLGLDLTKDFVRTRVDLVHCQEFVEHIEEKYVGNIINSFRSGKIIAMTHATPGQGGYHHVNEQPAEYWIKLMIDNGFALMREDSHRIRQLAKFDGAVYLAETGLIFRNLHRS
jgi:SAM-dependent methyltransferase